MLFPPRPRPRREEGARPQPADHVWQLRRRHRWTAALGGRLSELGTFAQSPEGGGRRVTGMAGDKRLLAFSHLRYRLENEDCHPCVWNVTGGRVTRVVKGGEQVSVPGVAPAALLAAGAGRLATAPALDPWEEAAKFFPSPRPAEDGPVNVVNAKTGDPVMTVSPTGTVRALALSADALAVLVEGAGTEDRAVLDSGRNEARIDPSKAPRHPRLGYRRKVDRLFSLPPHQAHRPARPQASAGVASASPHRRLDRGQPSRMGRERFGPTSDPCHLGA